MGREGLDEGYPFSGARCRWENPIPENFWVPKFWSTTGRFIAATQRLADPNGQFVTQGIAFNDSLFICDSDDHTTHALVVAAVVDEQQLDVFGIHPPDADNTLYKVGMKVHHTLQSLMTIIADRGIATYTMHWFRVWTSARRKDFDDDEKGDIYCIDPPSGQRLQHLIDEWDAANPLTPGGNLWRELTPRPEIIEP